MIVIIENRNLTTETRRHGENQINFKTFTAEIAEKSRGRREDSKTKSLKTQMN